MNALHTIYFTSNIILLLLISFGIMYIHFVFQVKYPSLSHSIRSFKESFSYFKK